MIGFHGCDRSVRDRLLGNSENIEKSEKPHDCLGHGMYFWENNLERAKQWAKDKEQQGEISEAAVIGAVLHLGICCDFLDSSHINLIAVYYELMKFNYEVLGKPLPRNKNVKRDVVSVPDARNNGWIRCTQPVIYYFCR